ncbi:MAG: heparinase II/III family protein [Brumimicrobium sp.]|nr:heparinase II/III family protein [Brumimicrobium sp.]
MKHISTYYHTLKYLKPIQIKYQLLYRLFKAKPLSHYKNSINPLETTPLKFIQSPYHYSSYLGNNKFTFLNQEKDFSQQIDWSYKEYGALWNYNLQYFNYLAQENITKEEKLCLLKDFYQSNVVLEPYPISLRSINTIRFILREEIQDSSLIENLYGELNFLSKRLEFHILGNHLLENLFALMMGGVFFQEEKWIQKAHALLIEQLDEQILNDGAHFELSPMYHQIMLNRVLELIDWYSTYEKKEKQFEHFLREKAAKMLAWLKNMTFSNGDIPMVNDAAKGVAPTTKELFEYAAKLEIKPKELSLTDSGYRHFSNEYFELLIDVGQISPSYQPGHSHADSLNFILNFQGKPIIVDTGISTYEKNSQRQSERATSAHNTVVVNNINSSDVWSGFRVGKRAKTNVLLENNNQVIASHDGYKHQNIIHQRTFTLNETEVIIDDLINNIGKTKNPQPLAEKMTNPPPSPLQRGSVGILHFHPDASIQQIEQGFIINDVLQLTIENAHAITLEEYNFAEGYNILRRAEKIKIEMNKKIIIKILYEV